MGVETGSRLKSLDALRGFDMFWIAYPTYPIFHALLVALGFGGCWLDMQMEHPEWAGFTFYDTIFPLFLFMAGVSFPYSYASSKAKGLPPWRMVLRILTRAAVLFLLGSTINKSLQFEFSKLCLTSVIGRIGIAWAVAALFYMAFRWRVRVGICAAILAVYGLVPLFVSAPGSPAGADPYAAANCIYWWMDGNVFPRPYIGRGAAGNFCMVATAMIGMFAGEWLRRESPGLTRGRKAGGLLLAAVPCLVVGLLWAYCMGGWSVPIIKKIWTSTYALVAASYSLAMLALFYWIIDVKGHVAWSFPFRVIGMNALFAYLASRTILPFHTEMNFLFGGVMRLCPTPEWGQFAGQLGYLTLYWLLLYYMYRKNIFLRA